MRQRNFYRRRFAVTLRGSGQWVLSVYANSTPDAWRIAMEVLGVGCACHPLTGYLSRLRAQDEQDAMAEWV